MTLTGVSRLIWAVAILSKSTWACKAPNSLNRHMQRIPFEQTIRSRFDFKKNWSRNIQGCVCVCARTCAQCKCGCWKGKSWKSSITESKYIMKEKNLTVFLHFRKSTFSLLFCQVWCLCFSLWALFTAYASNTSTLVSFLKEIRVTWPACLSGEAGLLKPW